MFTFTQITQKEKRSMTIANVILWQAFAIRAGLYLALLDRLSSLGLGLDPVPSEPALVLFGCWCKTSSSLAVVPSVSSLWTQTERHTVYTVSGWRFFPLFCTRRCVRSKGKLVQNPFRLRSVLDLTWTIAMSSWSCLSFCFTFCWWTLWTKSPAFPRLLLRLDPSLSGAAAHAPSSLSRMSSSGSSSFPSLYGLSLLYWHAKGEETVI